MSQDEPWTDTARSVLYAIYEFWAANGRPPSYVDLYRSTDVAPREMRQAFAELSDGMALAFPEERLQLSILKVPPYSALPTPVACYIDESFHAHLGCPAEAMTISRLPMYENRLLTIRSACACCFTPIELSVQDGNIVSVTPDDVRIAITSSPWSWGSAQIDRICDEFHFVLNSDHALQLDVQLARRSVVATPGQIRELGAAVAARRMHDPSWGPVRIIPKRFIRQLEKSGVNVDCWS